MTEHPAENSDLPNGSGGASGDRRSGVAAWCLYDWANSAFPTVVTTFIFATYFTQSVAATPVEGTILWSRLLMFTGLVVAVFSPLLGAIADNTGTRKPWIMGFSAICCLVTLLLWFVEPAPDYLPVAIVLYATAAIAYQFAIVFYDSMLPHIATNDRIGRISGWGWALGYLGGIACLLGCLWLLRSGGADFFGLDADNAEPVRASSIFVAIWFAVFSLPLFLLTRDRAPTGLSLRTATRAGIRQLWGTLRLLDRRAPITRFLIAHMFYNDGLVTLFAFGGIYAAAEFAMEPTEILIFGIALNIAAGAGAAGFAWVDDAIGPKRTILLALAGLILSGAGIILARSDVPFWIFATSLGFCVGPAQASGRSLMARLSPGHMATEMFGLYALAGKATAFSGPLMMGLIVQWTGSQRAGMASVLVFLVVGGLILFTVREPERRPS